MADRTAHPGDTGAPQLAFAVRVDLAIRRLDAGLSALTDQRREDSVHPVQDLQPRSPVKRQLWKLGTGCLDLVPGARVHRHVSAAKAVDRLLRVADQEQPSRLKRIAVSSAGECERDLHLQRIGVLELVDEQRGEALPERLSRALVVAQDLTHPHDQVVERQRPFTGARSCLLAHEGDDERQQCRQGGRPKAGQQLVQLF